MVSQIGQRGHVLARQLEEVGPERVALRRHPGEVARRVLHAGDVGEFVEPLHGLDRHVDDGARRDVVDDDGDADRIVDRLEVAVKALLAGLVVIGRHHQHGVGAGRLGMAGQRDGLVGVVGASARDHRHAAARFPDADLDDVHVLVVAERRAFARGAAGDQGVRALADLPVDEGPEGGLVEGAVLEGRDERRSRTPECRSHDVSRVSDVGWGLRAQPHARRIWMAGEGAARSSATGDA